MNHQILFDGSKFHSFTNNTKFSYPSNINIFELPYVESDNEMYL